MNPIRISKIRDLLSLGLVLFIPSCGSETQFKDAGDMVNTENSRNVEDSDQQSRSDDLVAIRESIDASNANADEDKLTNDEKNQVLSGVEPESTSSETSQAINSVEVIGPSEAINSMDAELSKPRNPVEQDPGSLDSNKPESIVFGEDTVSTSNDQDGQTIYSQVLIMQQPEKTQLDILWVVDSSFSMAEEQAYLGENFASFITSLADSNQEFQTAVTTTDICHGIDYLDFGLDSNSLPPLSDRACPFIFGGSPSTHLRGSFVGEVGRKVLQADDPDLISKFRSYTNVGTNGSNFEHGLRAASMAIEKVLAGENEGLLRDDAFLAVMLVSDEEDDGVGLSQYDSGLGFNPTKQGWTNFSYTPDDLISYLNSVKGNGKYSISTITGTRDESGNLCTSSHSNPEEEGAALISAAGKTGGIVQSICDTNWGESLSQLGQDLNAQASQITLKKTPIESTIKILVDGADYTHWTYVAGNNSIKLSSESIPVPGATIMVSYDSLDP